MQSHPSDVFLAMNDDSKDAALSAFCRYAAWKGGSGSGSGSGSSSSSSSGSGSGSGSSRSTTSKQVLVGSRD